MSAFVISEATMRRAVAAICGSGTHRLQTFAEVSTASSTAPMQIGRRLYSLNIEAVTQRYPDTIDAPADMPGEVGACRLADRFTAPAPKPLKPSALIDGYKALTCLRYQCTEGNVPETPLYRELDAAIAAIACRIVETSAQYETAAWDS